MMANPRWPLKNFQSNQFFHYYSFLEFQSDRVHTILSIFDITDYEYQVRFAKLICLNQII